MSETRRRDALRRLGGPVCPVCGAVDIDGKVEVRWISEFGRKWLRGRGKEATVKQGLAPMCQKCFLTLTNDEVAEQARKAEARAQENQRLQQEVEWMVRPDPRRGQMYRAAVAEHQGDLAAAEELAAGWGVGNGLFGSRGD
jgi:hypothetical protein